MLTSLLVLGAIPSGVLAGTSPLSVALWHDEAIGLKDGETLRVHAQVYAGATAAAPDNVTFSWGFSAPANYSGIYDNATGLFRADVNITAMDEVIGAGFLQVVVYRSNERAAANTTVFLSLGIGPPTGLWEIAASVSNLRETGSWIEPGERVNFTIATYFVGTLWDAPSLTADVFLDFDGSRAGAATRLTLSPGPATGVKKASYTVPSGSNESKLISLQLTVNESGSFYRVNQTFPVTSYDVLMNLSRLDTARITGALIVGDGRDLVAGAKADLRVLGGGYQELGVISATTDAVGRASFDFASMGHGYFTVTGWVNGSRQQFVTQSFSARGPLPALPTPRVTGFDAVPQSQTADLPWRGNVSLPFRFYHNGSVWANSPVVALVYSARGLVGAWTLTTNATGAAVVDANINQTPFSFEDYVFGGVHFLFRAAVGSDANSSDGFFWAEDDQAVAFNLNDGFLSLFGSPDVSLSMRPVGFGTPFGVGVKYTGPLDTSRWDGALLVLLNGPDTYSRTYGAGDVIELTASISFSSRNFAMMPGASGEFFGLIDLPSYMPERNLTIMAGMADLNGAVFAGPGSDSSRLTVVTVSPGQSLSGFSPAPESKVPEVYAKDLWVGSGVSTRLTAHGFDDTTTFPEQWNWTWSLSLPSGMQTVYGFSPLATIMPIGDFPATVTVRDGAGRTASASFTLHVGDFTAPSVSAGPDRALNGGISVAFDAVVTDNDPNFATTGIVHWNFTYNETNYTVDGTHLVFTFWRQGTVNLTVVGIDAAGNRATDTMTITVLPPDTTVPQILGLGGNRTEPLGLPLRLVASVTDNDPNFPGNARANWSFFHLGEWVVVNGTSANYTFWEVGNITLNFTVEDFWGNVNTSNVTIKFIAGSTLPPIADAGANITVRTGERVDFVGNASTGDPLFPQGANFTWTFIEGGDAVTLVNQLAFYAFRLEGAYTVTLTVEDRWGKEDQDTVQVIAIGPDTSPPLVTPIANKNVVVNTTLVLEPAVTDNSIVFSYTGNYTWTVEFEGQASTLYGKRQVYNFTKVGIYNWTLVVRDGALNPSEQIRFYVRVDLPDERPPLITATADSYRVVVGTTVQFHGTATDKGVNFTDDRVFNWTVRSGRQVWYITGINPFFKFEAPGQYNVTLRVNDTAGNVANESFFVEVTPAAGGGFLPGWSAYGAAAALGVAAGAVLIARRRRQRGPRDL